MSKPFRVAIVGAGFMGDVHAIRWKRHENVSLVGVHDSDSKAASRIDAPFLSTWAEVLEAKPDIIDICTPTTTHVDLIEKAAQAGKAIMVEKPLARTLADCDRCIDIVERHGVALMVAHVLRYFPEYVLAKKAVSEGRIGKPATVRMARMGPFPRAERKDNWYADIASSGGAILDMIIHDLDWLRWCFGEVSRIYAKGLYGKKPSDRPLDYALVTLRFKSGLMAHVTGSWAHVSGFRTTFEIAGDGGMLEHDSASTAPLSIAVRAKEAGATGGVALPESPLAPDQDPYYLQQKAFMEALSKGQPPPVTAHDAREAVRIAQAAMESVETGKVVQLS